MKFDVCVPCFFPRLKCADAVLEVAKAGYSAVEFWRLSDDDVESVKAAAEKTGVEIVSICLDDFRMNERCTDNIWLKALQGTINKALALGAKTLVTQVGQDTGEDARTQRDRIVSLLKRAAVYLSDAGVRIAIEPLNTIYDHKGAFLTTADEAHDIALEVNSPYVGIALDFYHQQAQRGDLINAYLRAKTTVKHVHIAGHPLRHEPWTGEVDYKNVFAALEKNEYFGFVGLEYIPAFEPRESLARFAEIYR